MTQHFYNAESIAQETGISRGTVYRHFRQLRQRDLSEPIPKDWPLEARHAERLINYIQQKKIKK